MPNADKMKECPFPHEHTPYEASPSFAQRNDGKKTYYIECVTCACCGPIADTAEEAATLWNAYTRPTPSVPGDDVMEAMAKAFYASKVSDGKWEHIPQNAKDAYLRCMQAALSAAEAMGYVLTKQEPS